MSSNRFSLEGRIALITGASSGIGQHLAKALASAGASIVLCARRLDKIQAVAQEIEAADGRAIAVAMDVNDRESINNAYQQAEDKLGVCDIIINSAGVADPKNFLKIDDDSLDFVMNTNFKGVWHVAQEGAKRLADADKPGSIINIASILGLGVQSGYSSYCASKGAVVQLTRALAHDLGRYNIRVNAIAPGWFKTEMNQDYFDSDAGKAYIEQTPAHRLGNLEELVGPVLLLASEAGSFINGVILPVDGAHHTQLV